MDPLENVKKFFALLFWFVNERNWTVQSTSTIEKPRKEGEEYKPGDVVVARFFGKKYGAVIVNVKDEREKLLDDQVQLDKLLKDGSLSPSDIIQKMGVKADLGSSSESNDPTKRAKGASKPAVLAKKAKTAECSKAKERPKEESLAAKVKSTEKQRKTASVESAKLMAARLLQNMDMVGGSTTQLDFTSHGLPEYTPEEDRTVCPLTATQQMPSNTGTSQAPNLK